MFWEKVGLDELDASQVNGLDKARANARAFVEEVMDLMPKNKEEEAA
jgi:hypothetical protein